MSDIYTHPDEVAMVNEMLRNANPRQVIQLPEGVKASDVQIAGDHYKKMKIQPFEYIHANNLGFAEGCVVKYVSRWRSKGGVDDLRKARHFIDLLIEKEITS